MLARRLLPHLHHCGYAATASLSRPLTTTTTYGTPPSHGSPAAAAFAQASEQIIVPGVCNSLRRNGYAVIDGALDIAHIGGDGDDGNGGGGGRMTLSETLLQELDTLAAIPGLMRPNATHLVQKDGTVTLEKANILEAEVHALGEDVLTTKAPTFRAVLEDRRCGGRQDGRSFFFAGDSMGGRGRHGNHQSNHSTFFSFFSCSFQQMFKVDESRDPAAKKRLSTLNPKP